MNCTQCGAENAPEAKFCNQCGQGLAVAPAVASNDPRAYTPKHLADKVLKHRSAMQGERKQVTVLFADMAGSTHLAEQLDPELWHQILDQFFAILAEEIHRYEGTINQFTGDGVMALFGAPLALEDHAQRAAHAALALKQRLRGFADGLRLEHGINLSTRMGMNSGEVIVGRIGDDLRMDYTAQGLTVNLAARMEQIAQPGSVYLTADTADLIGDYFSLSALGPMNVKGRSEPVRVYELVGKTAVSLRLEASLARGLTGLAGRNAELTRLKQLQLASASGQRQIMVLIGDAGLGKSRLCFEAVERWRQAGITVLSCSGMPHTQSLPLRPVRELILQRFGVSSADAAPVARQKVAGGLLMMNDQLRGQLPLLFDFLNIADTGSAPIALAPETRDQRIMEIFHQTCLIESQESRVILVEDLHWIDEGSHAYFSAMLDCAKCTSTLVLFNMRPDEIPDWLTTHEPEILALQPLDDEAMAQMTLSLLGSGPGMAELALHIALRAAGNPFFIEETVRALFSAGRLQGQPGAYELQGDVKTVKIPASVQAIIAGRVDKLDGEHKDLLQIAAVLGQRFPYRLLEAVSGVDTPTYKARLEKLETGNYLRPDESSADSEWMFCHPLLQDVVYGSLLSDRRRLLHEQVAELLEQHYQTVQCKQVAVALARHWEAAGNAVKAARWNVAAGVFMGQHNMREEIRLLRRAITLLTSVPESPEARQIAIAARAGFMRSATFYPLPADEVEQYYLEATEMAQSSGDVAALAELLISNGVRLLNQADADRAVENTGEAMRLAQSLSDNTLEGRFRIPILFSYFSAGRLRDGLKVLDQRDGGAWHEGPVRDDTMLSRGFRGLMLAATGNLSLALSEARASLARVDKHGLSVSWLYANMVDLQLLSGDLADGMQLARKAMQQAQEFGSPMFIEVAQRGLAQALLANGEAQQAHDVLLNSLDAVAPGAVAAQFEAAHRMVLSYAMLELGLQDAALEQADLAISAGDRSKQRMWALRAYVQRAWVLLHKDLDPSDTLPRIEVLIEETGANLFKGDALEIQAAWARRQKDVATAADLEAQAQLHWQACGAPARKVRGMDEVVA